MKYYYLKVCVLFLLILTIVWVTDVYANLPLMGKVILIDAGHGGIG